MYPHPEGDYWEYTADQVAGPMRTYTIRSVDPQAGEISVDFVVHPGGIAADWALSVQTGSEVGFNTPTGLYELPADATWQVLLADATGLPAAARLLENVPAGIPTTAILEVSGPDHEQALELGNETQGALAPRRQRKFTQPPRSRCCARWTCRRARATSGSPARPG